MTDQTFRVLLRCVVLLPREVLMKQEDVSLTSLALKSLCLSVAILVQAGALPKAVKFLVRP